jgi:hypothetical protein
MTVIKQKLLTEDEKYYSYPIKVHSEKDALILDQAKTTGMIFFGKREINYPKFWRGEKFKLPQNEFTIRKYEDIKFRIKPELLPYFDEGTRVELISDLYPHKYEFNKVFPLVNFCGTSWQHFSQDLLPILSFARDFLIENPDVIILTYPIVYPYIRDYFFKKFNIKNKVLSIPASFDSNRTLDFIAELEFYAKCNELYNFESNIQVPTEWWNSFFYRDISNLLHKDEVPSTRNNVVYLRRGKELYRTIYNDEEVIETLSNYSKKNNLNFIIFEHQNYTIEQQAEIIRNAHTIVASHGGNSCNVIFAPKGAKFIEYTYIDTLYSMYNMASSLELDYYMVPNRGDLTTLGIYVDIKKLIDILEF